MNVKTTRRALTTSVISLLICVAMLMGTTFAWFTDSVTSGRNKIVAGNLDVELEYKNNWADDWKPVTNTTKIFKDGALYEPGYTEVVYLRVVNKGTLALKYNLSVNVWDEKSSVNVYDDEFNLSDYLMFGTYRMDEYSSGANYADLLMPTLFGTREAALSNVSLTKFSEADSLVQNDRPVFPGDETSQVNVLVLTMPETVGNEANHKAGAEAPTIDLGIELLATQYTHESDSFDNLYDEFADYDGEISTLAAFKQALKKGGKYKLNADITNDVAESFEVPAGVSFALDLNKHTLTNAVAGAPALVNNGTLVISGEGAVVNGVSDTGKSHTVRNYGTLIINGGNIGTFATAGAAVVNDGTATINGGTFASRQEENAQYGKGPAAYCFINNGTGTMTINDATVDGPTHGIFAAYAGKLVVNGGNYTLVGNNGMGCYVVYSTGEAEVVLMGGTVNTNEPRHSRTFYVSNGGNHFNQNAVDTDNLTYIGTEIYLNGVKQTYTEKDAYVSDLAELKAAIEEKKTNIILLNSVDIDGTLVVDYDAVIDGSGNTIGRADGFTGTMFTVTGGATLALENVTVDGGAVWTGTTDATLGRGTVNGGVKATGNIVATEANSHIVLNDGSVLQNNDGAHAVNLGTRIGATLTLNGGQIINNNSDSGAVWGGGNITVNDGSKINGNSSTGLAGAIRMVGKCNLTMNGGEISNNKAVSDGGAIWGYGINGNTSVYNLNGGKMNNNVAGGTGGAIYTGTYSTVNISGDFEMCNNTAADSGAMRLTNYTGFNMTGGKIEGNVSINNSDDNGFNSWNPIVNISGGELVDDVTIVGGHTPVIGGDGITGVIHFAISTNHNTVNLAKDFGTIKFTVAEGTNFAAFNFKPAADYTYTAGDEAKLVCLNAGYETYWDTATSTFRLQAK